MSVTTINGHRRIRDWWKEQIDGKDDIDLDALTDAAMKQLLEDERFLDYFIDNMLRPIVRDTGQRIVAKRTGMVATNGHRHTSRAVLIAEIEHEVAQPLLRHSARLHRGPLWSTPSDVLASPVSLGGETNLKPAKTTTQGHALRPWGRGVAISGDVRTPAARLCVSTDGHCWPDASTTGREGGQGPADVPAGSGPQGPDVRVGGLDTSVTAGPLSIHTGDCSNERRCVQTPIFERRKQGVNGNSGRHTQPPVESLERYIRHRWAAIHADDVVTTPAETTNRATPMPNASMSSSCCWTWRSTTWRELMAWTGHGSGAGCESTPRT